MSPISVVVSATKENWELVSFKPSTNMAVLLVLGGIFVSLSCCLKATLGEEIAGGLL